MFTPPRIPDEVLNMIFEHRALENSKDLLCVCSLVCKAWLPVARYHLFRKVVLHLDSDGNTTFLGLLQHPLCSFTDSVRKVRLLPAQSTRMSQRVNTDLAVLNRLTRVNALCLHDQKIIPLDTLQVISTVFKDITSLTMMLRFKRSADGIQFMSSFSQLEEVHFELVRTPVGDPPPNNLSIPPKLRSLRLNSIRGHECWFSDHRLPSMTTLSLYHIRPLNDIPRLTQMLQTFGRNLRHLTLRFDAQKGDLPLEVNFSYNTELRYLEIDLSALTKKHISPVLATLNACDLEMLVWRNRKSFDDFSKKSWEDLDALVSDRERFRALVAFEIRASNDSTKYNPRARMPLSEARGVLSGSTEI
ncbi:RING-type domain-containing protein [Mycena indigotica]|uniref:RING-type domain-containing protein n=1 Tax=Mycena indigotica TaxID=2126181 RepID=A0A8H6T0Y7_9AGAR|nr:RING-type domain-containing protein [Mycena indigotica]KAF7309965.1 RING-type domain-containing protein [Mycena indigotica]